jgi:hypothetical protein
MVLKRLSQVVTDEDDRPKTRLGMHFTCFTATKVHILTQKALARAVTHEATCSSSTALLALLLQKYKF